MFLDEILEKRRSVRAYQDRPVEPEKIRALCEAARVAPSACNSQTWRFVVVTDPELLRRICREATRSVVSNRWIERAPVVIVGCSVLDFIANRLGSAVTGIDYFQLDMGIAMEHMVLKAVELGLGTCWVGWFNERKVKNILQIPRKVRVTALLTVGYPEEPIPQARSRKKLGEIAFWDSWNRPIDSFFSDV